MNLYFTFENKVALEKKMENIWFIFLHFQVPQRKLGKELEKGSSGKKTTKAVSAFFLLTILMRMQQNEKKKQVFANNSLFANTREVGIIWKNANFKGLLVGLL